MDTITRETDVKGETLYPDAVEVRAVWESARAVTSDLQACAWLESRALAPARVADLDLARVLDLESAPAWGQHWVRGEYRLLVPLWDATGSMRSFMARRVWQGDGPKSLPPYAPETLRVRGLCLASPAAVRALRDGEPMHSLVVCEGEPDFLTWAESGGQVLGVRSGSWSSQWSDAVAEGATVYLRTDCDQAGDLYARKIGQQLRHASCMRLRGQTLDDNARALAGDLPPDPGAGCEPYTAPDDQPRLVIVDHVSPGSEPTRERRYAERALAGEVDRVRSAPERAVNDTINRAGFAAFRLCKGAGAPLSHDEVRAALESAALERGHARAAIRSTLTSAYCGAPDWPGLPASTLDDRLDSRARSRSLARLSPPSKVDAPAPDSPQAKGEDQRDDEDLLRADTPIVRISTDRLAPMIDALESALIASGQVYQRSGVLVHVVRLPVERRRRLSRAIARPRGTPIIAPVEAGRLRELAAELLTWAKWDKRKKRWRSTLPPLEVISGLIARGQWSLPEVEAVSSAPQLRTDGSICVTPGLDDRTGVVVDIDPDEWPAAQDEPTRDDAQAALGSLFIPLQDFPFKAGHDRAAALAAVLTACARGAIDGATPLFAVRAPVAGSGKSLLATVVSMIATGREPALMSPSKTDEEDRKRLMAIAIAADPVVVLDNIEAPLGSAALAAALTAGAIRDRVLGETRLITAPWRAVTMATGNNLILKGDLARRVVPIDLDPRCESPEERSGFKVPRLREYVTIHRRRLYMDAMTVLRAYILSGAPRHERGAMGSFEGWSDLIRGALIWAGTSDPCEGRAQLRQDSDTGRASLASLLTAWHAVHSDAPISLSDLLDGIEARQGGKDLSDDLELALQSIAGDRRGVVTPKALGYALRSLRDRIIEGLRLESAGQDRRRKALWRVSRVR